MKQTKLPHPTNQKALALYLLLQSGKKGMNTFEAILDCMFYKLSARVWNLINDHNVQVHTKDEKHTNRFKHKSYTTRYFLYVSDTKKNLELYQKLNKSK